ncbi:MAG: hypothetical protein JW819_06540 [Candidatus Krumholzibacteriota bacterium]|nr:hypothetical protein [Candidatus Krumholzibacteriota bacterium]
MLESRRRWATTWSLLLLVALALGLGCRKELPELFDRNNPPETYITAAPVESLFDGFQVHLHWYGRDPDGEVVYYLWAWTDSSEAYYAAWNPETNIEDRILREGNFDATHLTTRTDSIFFLRANDNGGTSRDLTFNITAVDDKGRRDPVPARLYFTASVDQRPQIIWVNEPPETLSVGEAFSCRFTGATENGYLLGYQWSSGSDPSWYPQDATESPVWSFQHPSYADSAFITLHFANDPLLDPAWLEYYRYGIYAIRAKCLDLAGVESEVDADPEDLRGVVLPILNRDPNTRLRPQAGADYPLIVTYSPGQGLPDETLYYTADSVASAPGVYHYAVNDTLPWGQNAYAEFHWQGWDTDDPMVVDYDMPDDVDFRFQTGYSWISPNLNNLAIDFSANSRLYPPSDSDSALGYPEELNLPGAFGEFGKEYFINIAPVNYTVRGFAIDHFGRVDGTPARVTFTGGHKPVFDSIVLTSPGAADSVDLLALPPGDPVTIKLQAQFVAPPAAGRFTWDEGTRTAIIQPVSVETYTYDNYEIVLRFYGHDDDRNGVATQLGRFWWNLLDEEYSNSTNQFINEKFWVEEGTFIKNWAEMRDEDGDPVTAGAYTLTLGVRELVTTVLAEETPAWLGGKDLRALFCNTLQNDAFTEYIETQQQRQFSLSTVGRLSEQITTSFSIEYLTLGRPTEE